MLLKGTFDESLFAQGERIYFRQKNPDVVPRVVYVAGKGETLDGIYAALEGYFGEKYDEYEREYYDLNKSLKNSPDLSGKHVQIPFYLAHVASKKAPTSERNLKKILGKLNAFYEKMQEWTVHVYRVGGNHGFRLRDPNK